MTQLIAVQPIPSQSFKIKLSEQNCNISLIQRSTGIFIDLFVDNRPILQSVLCLDRVKLVRYRYLKFVGDLVFFDTAGVDNPSYLGLGSRFLFAYLDS